MTLEDFYALLLPQEGTKFVATHTKFFSHHAVSTIEEMVAKTEQFDAKNITTYFACAAYKAPSFNANGKTVYRVQENILSAKCLWWDIDCGPNKDYPDQATALMKLKGFLLNTGVPDPLIVSSGNGLHCYWPLEEPVEPKRWKQMATLLHEIAVRNDFKMDHSRSRDMTSVLRPIGTHNRKGAPKLVEIISECTSFGNDDFTRGLLRLYRETTSAVGDGQQLLPITLDTAGVAGGGSINDDLVGDSNRNFPPSDADIIAEHCQQIAFFKDTGSDNEPHWRTAANTVKYCENGEAIAHAWSSKYVNYDQKETQEKLDRWTTGPAKCATFNNHNNLCDKCPHLGKVTGPIQLGLPLPTTPVVIEVESPIDELAPRQKIPLPWGIELSENDRLAIRVVDPKTKVVKLVEFCDVFFYMYARVKDYDGTMSVGINARIRKRPDGSWEWKKFMIPTSLIGERGSKLRSELGRYEIVAMQGKDMHMESYMQRWLDMLRQQQKEINSYRTFGNQPDGSLLVGTTLYQPDGSESEVIVNAPATTNVMPAFRVRDGNPDAQRKLLQEAYGHVDHAQFQFQTFVSLGSVMIDMCGLDTGGVWNLFGGKGQGKTTACEMGLSLWGDPKYLSVKWGKDGTTDNALYSRVSAHHSIPFLVDEVTGITAEQASALMYQLQSGKAKEVLGRDRRPVAPLPPWRLMGWLTSNGSIQDTQATGKDDASAELTRSLEVHWRGDVQTIDKNDMTRIQYHMTKHYGAIGREFAQYLAPRRDMCHDILTKFQQKLDSAVGMAKEQRFWSAMVASAVTAGYIATKEGILPWDFAPLLDYGVGVAKQNMSTADTYTSSPTESLHRMISAMGPFTITTEKLGDGRIDRVPVMVSGEPVARIIRGTGEMFISIPAIREWCVKRQVGYNSLRDAAHKAGVLLDPDTRFYIGKGTDRPTGQLRCWRMDWGMLQSL